MPLEAEIVLHHAGCGTAGILGQLGSATMGLLGHRQVLDEIKLALENSPVAFRADAVADLPAAARKPFPAPCAYPLHAAPVLTTAGAEGTQKTSSPRSGGCVLRGRALSENWLPSLHSGCKLASVPESQARCISKAQGAKIKPDYELAVEQKPFPLSRSARAVGAGFHAD